MAFYNIEQLAKKAREEELKAQEKIQRQTTSSTPSRETTPTLLPVPTKTSQRAGEMESRIKPQPTKTFAEDVKERAQKNAVRTPKTTSLGTPSTERNTLYNLVKNPPKRNDWDLPDYKTLKGQLADEMKQASEKVNAAEINPHLNTNYTSEQRQSDIDTYTKKYRDTEAFLEKTKKEQRDPKTYEKSLNDPNFSIISSIGATKNSKVNNAFKNKDAILNSSDLVSYGDEKYITMNDQERSLYNYFVGKGLLDTADDYLASIDNELNQRFGAMLNARIEKIEDPKKRFNKKMQYGAYSGLEKGVTGLGDFWNAYIALNDSVPSQTSTQTAHALNMENADPVTKFVGDLGYSVGNMIPSVALSYIPVVGPGVAAAFTGASTAGSSYADARREGKEFDESLKFGGLDGVKEASMQALLGGISKLGGKFGVSKIASKFPGKIISNTVDKLAKNPSVKAAFKSTGKYIANAGDEAFEEYLQTILEPAIRNVAFDENNEIKPFSEEALYSAALGFASAGLFNATDVPSLYRDAKADAQSPVQPLPTPEVQVQELPVGGQESNANDVVVHHNTSANNDKETLSIKEQIKKYSDEIDAMQPVFDDEVYIENKGKAKNKEWILSLFEKLGFKVNRSDIGDVVVDKKRISKSLNYINTDGELAAYSALPYVLKNGKKISGHSNHKNRGYDTETIVAPIVINGVRGNMGAVVIRDEHGNFYRVHRVLMPDGSAFVYKNNRTNVGTSGATANKGVVTSTTDADSTTTIPQTPPVVNPEVAELPLPAPKAQVQESAPTQDNASIPETFSSADYGYLTLEDDSPQDTTSNSLLGWVSDKKAEMDEKENRNFIERAAEIQKFNAKAKTEPKKLNLKKDVANLSNEFRRKFVDAGASVQDMAKVTGDTHLYAYYNNTKQAQAAGQNMITKAQTNLKGKKVGKSLDEIFKPVLSMGEEYTKNFQEYMWYRHNIDRIKAGKPITFTEDLGSYMKTSTEIVDTLLRQHPEFEKIANDVYTYLRNLMQMRVDSGLVTKQEADFMNELYPHYVPTHREMDENYFPLDTIGEENAIIGTGIKRALGSDLDLMPLYEQISKMTMQTVSQAKRNIFANRLADLAYTHPLETVSFVQNPKEYEGIINLDDLQGDLLNGNMLVYHRNGKTEAVKLSDGMVEAIKDLQVKNHGDIYNFARKLNELYKKPITEYNPVFTIRNFMRDFPDALFASKDTTAFLKYFPEAMSDIKNNGEIWQQFEALGGTASSFFDYDYKTGTFNESNWLKRNTLDRISEMNRFVEMIPRFAEFYATVKKGGDNYANLMDALYNAAEITVNFQRGGSWGKPMNATAIPFLNASIQGASKNLRLFTETKGSKEWLAMAIKAALFGLAPSVINELLLGDDEEYKELRDYDKMDNYIFKLPNNQFIKIPGGRLTKSIGTFGAEVVKFLRGDETDFGKVGMNALSQVGPLNPIESIIIMPAINAGSNLSLFGGEIENERLQSLPVAERYDSDTSEIGKWIGKTFNVSPKKTDYLIDSYTGIIGDVILPIFTNPEGENVSLGDKVGSTTKKAFVDPFLKKFYIDGTMSNQLSQKYYDKRDEILQKSNGSAATPADELAAKYMNSQNKKLSDLYSTIREYESDTSRPYSEREADIRNVQEEINNTQRTILENLNKYNEAAKKYSSEEDKEVAYFLANKDVMGIDYAIQNMSNDSQAKKMKTFTDAGISPEKSFDIMDNFKDIKSDTDDWGRSVSGSKNKKSVEYVEGLGLNAKQKAAVYKTYLYSETDKKYNMFANAIGIDDATLGNIYGKLSTIEGTKNNQGKTISGSQNKNVYNYINSLDLSAEKRRLLFAWFASSTNEQKKQRYNAINNLSLSAADKNIVLEWLSGNKTISEEYIKKIFGRIKK